jgi:hypothetical protein
MVSPGRDSQPEFEPTRKLRIGYTRISPKTTIGWRRAFRAGFQYVKSWQVTNVKELDAALASRDKKCGAMFSISPDDDEYPSLAIRVTKDYADVHYFPYDGHPGFRCLGGEELPEGGWTSLVYQGCDPGDGEETPNEFIVPFATACAIANEFFRSGERSGAVEWLEL